MKLGWRVCGNALINARLSKFINDSKYQALQQSISKVPIRISKNLFRLQEGKTHMKLLMFSLNIKITQNIVIRYRSCMSLKIISLCLLKTKFGVGLENEGVDDGRHE